MQIKVFIFTLHPDLFYEYPDQHMSTISYLHDYKFIEPLSCSVNIQIYYKFFKNSHLFTVSAYSNFSSF